ncbi:LSM domain-containing protein [Seiridium cupressi]
MENLAIHDTPPPGQGTPQGRFGQQAMAGNAPPQAQHQQLPPQMFTTAAQLLDLTDRGAEKLLICLRDGRKLTGILRSWDQFDATEDSSVKGYYADKTHGIFLVRGENVLLLGEIDLDKDDETPADFEEKEWKVVEKLAKEKKFTDKVKEKKKLKKLATLGFEGENMGEILL